MTDTDLTQWLPDNDPQRVLLHNEVIILQLLQHQHLLPGKTPQMFALLFAFNYLH